MKKLLRIVRTLLSESLHFMTVSMIMVTSNLSLAAATVDVETIENLDSNLQPETTQVDAKTAKALQKQIDSGSGDQSDTQSAPQNQVSKPDKESEKTDTQATATTNKDQEAAQLSSKPVELPAVQEDYTPEEPKISLLRHKEIYFISGTPDTKVQMSFKMGVFGIPNLYFGYTQRLFWDLFKESAPFTDINHLPEIYYRIKLDRYFFDSIDIAPIEHYSNGRGSVQSRSLNRAYVRLKNKLKIFGLKTRVESTIYYYYETAQENRDFFKYNGFYDVRLTFDDVVEKWLDQSSFSIFYYAGGNYSTKFNGGAIVFDLRARILKDPKFPFIYIQHFNGYSEGLLEYNKYHQSTRIGLMF